MTCRHCLGLLTTVSHNMDAGVKERWILLTVVLILFSSLKDSRADGTPSFCNIPPVKEGGNATLTCTFTENISVVKRDFEIDRYSSTNSKQETLLVCTWINDEPTCYLNPRITFDRVVTKTLQIQIPKVTSADAGKYICYVLPAPNGISKSCNLTFEETAFIPETDSPGYKIQRSNDLPIINTSTLIQDSKEDRTISTSLIGIIIAVNIAFLILQGIFFLIAFKYCKRHSKGGASDNHKNANNKEIKPNLDVQDANQLHGLLINSNVTCAEQANVETQGEKETDNREKISKSYIQKSSSEHDISPAIIEKYKINSFRRSGVSKSVVTMPASDYESGVAMMNENDTEGFSMSSVLLSVSEKYSSPLDC